MYFYLRLGEMRVMLFLEIVGCEQPRSHSNDGWEGSESNVQLSVREERKMFSVFVRFVSLFARYRHLKAETTHFMDLRRCNLQ